LANASPTAGASYNAKIHRVEFIFMIHPLSHPPPLLLPGIFHRHLGIDGEGAAIPAPKSFSLILNQLITNIKAKTSGTKEGANTTT